jgi:hypothetical protein
MHQLIGIVALSIGAAAPLITARIVLGGIIAFVGRREPIDSAAPALRETQD